MADYTVGPRREFEPLPTGDYQLTLKSWKEVIEEKNSQYSKKGDRKLEWTFVVAVPNEDNQERRVRTRIVGNWNEKSTLCHVLLGLGLTTADEAMAKGLTFDPDQAIGRKCVGTILRKAREDGKGMTDSIISFSPSPFLATAPVGPGPLQQRYDALLNFAGLEKGGAILTPAAMKQSMIDIGRQNLFGQSSETLHQAVEMLHSLGGADYREEEAKALTLRDGLLLLDAINKELDALEHEGSPF